MKRTTKLLLLTVLGTWMAGSAMAEDGLYLVGGATASGWEAGEYHRSPVSMMQKDANTWIWFGKLTKGDGDAGAFKIPNQSGNWDGYWAPSAWYALEPGVEADLSTNSTGDNKFSPTEEGLYKVTINTATNKIRADKLTNVPTKDGDYYLISTVNDFYWFAAYIATDDTKASKARLTADLDFTDDGYFPLASDKFKFKGELDGAGHTVKINIIGKYNNVGFFRWAADGANIHDFVLEGSVEGNAKVAGLIGHIHDGGEVKLTNVVNKATVKATGTTDANASAFVGCAEGGTKITALNCANMGSVSGQDGQCAAFCGWSQGGTTFTNCWNSGTITNMESNCNLYRNTSGVVATNCYDATGTDFYTQGEKVAATTIASGELCYLLNGKKSVDVSWYQAIGTDAAPLPFGTAIVYANGALHCDGLTPNEGSALTFSNTEGSTVDDHTWGEWGFCTFCDEIQPNFMTAVDGCYSVSTAKQLNWVAVWTASKDANVNVKLMNDIDLGEVANFPGLGSDAKNFTGTFDGQRHIISNMKMDWAREGVGLINRAANGAKVKNVTIASNCSVKGDKAVAALIGGLYGGGDVYIENCGNEGAVETTGQNAGGVCGVCFNGTKLHLTNVYNVGTITGATANESGSLSGWMQDAIAINCYSIAGYPTATDTHGFQEGNQFARGGGIALTNCYDFGTGDWGKNNGSWGSVFEEGAGKIAEVNETEMGRVFAGLFDAEGGNVWRMEYDGWAHPVLYDPANLVVSENVPNRYINKTGINFTLKRTLVKDNWNTICLPFELTTSNQQFLFGLGEYKIAELKGVDGDGETLQFETVTGTMTAGKPYLVKPIQDVTEKLFNNIDITAETPTAVNAGDFTFTGIFEPTLIAENDLFVAAGNKLQPSDGTGKLKGFRAYFKTAAGARATSFVVDGGTTTGIIGIDGTVIENGKIYNLNGQKVQNAQKGLYIVNGKKVVVK